METKELSKITIADFKFLVNQKFEIVFADNVSVRTELVEVLALEGYSKLKRIPFSLVFKTDLKNEYYKQGIYQINYPGKGQIEAFLVPIGIDKDGVKYEAVFS